MRLMIPRHCISIRSVSGPAFCGIHQRCLPEHKIQLLRRSLLRFSLFLFYLRRRYVLSCLVSISINPLFCMMGPVPFVNSMLDYQAPLVELRILTSTSDLSIHSCQSNFFACLFLFLRSLTTGDTYILTSVHWNYLLGLCLGQG
jgi:hypothetical protein